MGQAADAIPIGSNDRRFVYVSGGAMRRLVAQSKPRAIARRSAHRKVARSTRHLPCPKPNSINHQTHLRHRRIASFTRSSATEEFSQAGNSTRKIRKLPVGGGISVHGRTRDFKTRPIEFLRLTHRRPGVWPRRPTRAPTLTIRRHRNEPRHVTNLLLATRQ